MTPEIASAIAMLKAKVLAIAGAAAAQGDHPSSFDVGVLREWSRWDVRPPTMDQLRWSDDPIEEHLRRAFPQETQKEIRAKLDAEFGQSTVGELFEVVAKRILERGSVANDEEFEACETFVWTMADYGQQVLGVADARRLSGLLEFHRTGNRGNYNAGVRD